MSARSSARHAYLDADFADVLEALEHEDATTDADTHIGLVPDDPAVSTSCTICEEPLRGRIVYAIGGWRLCADCYPVCAPTARRLQRALDHPARALPPPRPARTLEEATRRVVAA